jgi:hypothetical protein
MIHEEACGQPRIPPELRRLLAEMGAANRSWGEERIAAELTLKLGIADSPRTVRQYMLVIRSGGACPYQESEGDAFAKTNRWKVVGPKRGFLIRGDDRIGVLGGTA